MKLFEELKQFNKSYEVDKINQNDTILFNQKDKVNMVMSYTESKYLNSQKDSLGRDKPFYNIVNGMVETAVVATDLDTKDIQLEAEKESDQTRSMLFNHEIKKWMEETNFAKTLNDMGETRARYGGVLVKKTEKEGKLNIDVVEWKNVCNNQYDILGGLIIEKHYMTPIQLKEKEGVWDNLDEAIKLYSKKGYTKVDENIEVWEVHGELPMEYLEDPEMEVNDTEGYVKQIHFIAVKASKYVCLYSAEEKELPYKYLAWKKRAGLPNALGRGVIEEGEESQVWTNDAIQKEQAAMELSGKVVLKTNSKKVGSNIITDLDNGSIVTLEDGKDMNPLNLMNGALPQFQNMVNKWWSQYERVTSSYDAVRGETPPSGQPYRLQALVQNAGNSQFDYRREEWGIFLKELFFDWVIPHLKKKISKKHILSSEFTPEELENIDKSFAVYNANKKVADTLFDVKPLTMEEYLSMIQGFRQVIAEGKQRRFLDIPDGYFNDLKGRVKLNITGESKNKMAMMESLSTILQTVASNPQILQDKNTLLILNRIIEISGSGLSPLSLSVQQNPQQTAPQAPQEADMSQMMQLTPQ